MLKFRLVIVVSFTMLLLALAGCRGMVAPPEATTLTVMTYNIYVGTEVAGIFTLADPALVPGEISKMYGNIVASDFPGRAAAIAKSVKEAQPHLIGLQEVSLIRSGGTEFSFRAILMSTLEAADLDYEVVAEVQNAHIELGVAALTDFDLILARSDVEVARPMSANYTESLLSSTTGHRWRPQGLERLCRHRRHGCRGHLPCRQYPPGGDAGSAPGNAAGHPGDPCCADTGTGGQSEHRDVAGDSAGRLQHTGPGRPRVQASARRRVYGRMAGGLRGKREHLLSGRRPEERGERSVHADRPDIHQGSPQPAEGPPAAPPSAR